LKRRFKVGVHELMRCARIMKILHIILPVLVVCGIPTARGEWKLRQDEGQTILLHEWDAKKKEAPSIEGLAEILASRDQSIPLKHITFWTYFHNDPVVQGELLAEFKSRYPRILAEAFRSSGNMHNPKVLPLRAKFSECLLATPTLTKINEVFQRHGYTISRISYEKFWINKDSESTPFNAIIWLIPEPSGNEEAQQAAPHNP
jgi:hypothetical protein